jgi:hypothetical protein
MRATVSPFASAGPIWSAVLGRLGLLSGDLSGPAGSVTSRHRRQHMGLDILRPLQSQERPVIKST